MLASGVFNAFNGQTEPEKATALHEELKLLKELLKEKSGNDMVTSLVDMIEIADVMLEIMKALLQEKLGNDEVTEVLVYDLFNKFNKQTDSERADALLEKLGGATSTDNKLKIRLFDKCPFCKER